MVQNGLRKQCVTMMCAIYYYLSRIVRIHAGRYWTEGLGPACGNGELYGFSQPLLQLLRPLIETPVCFGIDSADE